MFIGFLAWNTLKKLLKKLSSNFCNTIDFFLLTKLQFFWFRRFLAN